jgi:glycosyltransferase involved in cell wall biosynthesis
MPSVTATRLSDVVLVDDGSASTAAVDRLEALTSQFEQAGITPTVLEHGTNLGMRHAMATASRHAADADIYAAVDSDTLLEPDAIIEAYNEPS